jgi:hypothetical protein
MEALIGVMVAGIFVGDFVLRAWREAEWKRAARRWRDE